MQITVEILAKHLGGIIEGNPDIKITSPARIESGKEGNVCFLANPKYEKFLYTTKASVILLNKSFVLKESIKPTIIRVDDAYQAIASSLTLFDTAKTLNKKGREYPSRVSWRSKKGKNCYIGAFAYISKGVVLGNNVKIHPQVYLGDNVKVGDNTIIYPGVKVYAYCEIGVNCIIHSGCIIGSDGFGFAPQANGTYKKIPQTGNVIIHNDVEIGANTVVDKATMGSTVIGNGTKLDNLVQIAHNVEIGKNTVIAAQTGIAGSTKVGDNCMFAGHIGITGHIHIGNNVQVGGMSGVSKNVAANSALMGNPAMDIRKYHRITAAYRNLLELREDVMALKKQSEKDNIA